MNTSIDSSGAVMISILTAICRLFAGLFIGYVSAHNIIATECERLNGFYVGSKTFICDKKEQ
jgi:hypothetical protein